MGKMYVYQETFYSSRDSNYKVSRQFVVKSGKKWFYSSRTIDEEVMREQIRLLKKRGTKLISGLPPSVKKTEKLEKCMIVKSDSPVPERVIREGYNLDFLKKKSK